ncbi:MAG: hypothetical protein ACYTFG_06350 [Planctomycetota bacterium]|jgi:hypothetical protein
MKPPDLSGVETPAVWRREEREWPYAGLAVGESLRVGGDVSAQRRDEAQPGYGDTVHGSPDE